MESGFAITIQLPPGTSGQAAGGGMFHVAIDGQPKQNAAHAPSVSVGVT